MFLLSEIRIFSRRVPLLSEGTMRREGLKCLKNWTADANFDLVVQADLVTVLYDKSNWWMGKRCLTCVSLLLHAASDVDDLVRRIRRWRLGHCVREMEGIGRPKSLFSRLGRFIMATQRQYCSHTAFIPSFVPNN